MGTVHYLENAKTLKHYQAHAECVQEKSKALGYHIQRYMDASKVMYDTQRELREFCSSYQLLKRVFRAEKMRQLERAAKLAEKKYDNYLRLVTTAREELYVIQFSEDRPFLI